MSGKKRKKNFPPAGQTKTVPVENKGFDASQVPGQLYVLSYEVQHLSLEQRIGTWYLEWRLAARHELVAETISIS